MTIGPPDFVPKRRIIIDVTRALNAVVTTSEEHGYETGLEVRLIVPKSYGMELNFIPTEITVDTTTQFTTRVDTRSQDPFVTPTFPPGFTDAQTVPISGETDNIAGDL